MKLIIALFALVPALAWAGPFDGTWLTKVETYRVTGKPDTFLVENGMFTCGACYPGFKIKADGSDQKVTGQAHYDTVSVRVMDSRHVQMITQSAGKMRAERTYAVATDGKSMTEEFITYEGPKPAKGVIVYARVDAGALGANALSGSWQAVGPGSSMSSDLITVTYAETQDGLRMSTPTGQSFDAKFDGKAYLIAGDPGKTMVSLKRIDKRTIQETDSRDGKVAEVILYKVSADGKTLDVTDEDKLRGTKASYTAERKAM